MIEKLKRWLASAEESYTAWIAKPWAKRLSITGSVLWNLTLLVAIFLVIGAVFAASVGAGYFASLVDDEKLRPEEEMRDQVYSYEETSEMYFASDVYLGRMRSDLHRIETTLDNVPEFVIDAVLATEDEYFYEHDGIVPKAVLRGLLQDVTDAETQTGGSTLTQQLIKNQILTNEVSYERKAKELLLAMRLEKFMSKEEILEAYLNIIPYGRNSAGTNIAGIETAAKSLFNVSAKDLNLPQAAFIAGIPQAPSRYTPYTSTGALKDAEGLQPGIDRMKTVLFRMRETGVITEQEYNEAAAYDIAKDFRTGETRSYERYPFVTVEVEKRATRVMMDILAEQNGIDPASLEENSKLYEEYEILADRELRTGGYRIHTTIDKELYDTMDKAQKEYSSEWYGRSYTIETTDSEGNPVQKPLPVQIGSVIMENKTGRILSFIGGRDHELSTFNHATQAYRSMGSTVKPLLVYGPAIEQGLIGAGSPVVDVKFTINDGGRPYSPSNFVNNSEKGIIPARMALYESQNLPTLRLFHQLRDNNPFQYMMKAGFERVSEENNVPSAALGGGVQATVEEVANGYAAIANGGQFIDGYMIEKITDADGNVVFEHKPEPQQMFSPQTAYILTDMLRDVFDQPTGTAHRANNQLNFNADFAGKTGTTQDAKDSWLTGYNPNITMTVWIGYDSETRNLRDWYIQPSTRINRLWSTLMNTAYSVRPELVGTQEQFQAPEGVVTRSFCGISGLAPGGGCTGSLVRSDLFNANVMVPTKPDDSMTSGSFTTIGGTRYMALPSTPSEFVSGGRSGVSKAFVDRMLGPLGGDASKLFPGNSAFSNVVSGSQPPNDGVAPAGVSASIDGRIISWSNSASRDVVGYRVYRSGSGGNQRIASISEADGNSYRLPSPGTYFVVAVDVTGQQSPASNRVSIQAAQPAPAPEPTPEPESQDEGGNGNSNSNNSNSNSGNDGGSAPPPENGGDEEEPSAEEDSSNEEESSAEEESQAEEAPASDGSE